MIPAIKPSIEEEVPVIAFWKAIWAIALGVASLITAEFLPVSLLTPLANDLGITEGLAGQTISGTAVAALISSCLITPITQRLDRRWVLLSFCVLQIVSCLIVCFSPNFPILLIGRVLLGIGIGGFWAMSAATAMRLVPSESIPKALSIIFGAVSIATVIAAPMGSFLGAHMSWRYVFLIAGGMGLIALISQAATLPSMKTKKHTKFITLFHVLKRTRVKEGMLATMFLFMGYATFFTYLRPFLENVVGVNETTLTTYLLSFGIANLVGTTLGRFVLEKSLKWSMVIVPLIMSALVTALVIFGSVATFAGILIALWGMAFGITQVGWPTWLTCTLPDEAESGGGIQVATIQLAISLGAAFGGFFLDLTGILGVYICSSIITLIAGIAAYFAFDKQNSKSDSQT